MYSIRQAGIREKQIKRCREFEEQNNYKFKVERSLRSSGNSKD